MIEKKEKRSIKLNEQEENNLKALKDIFKSKKNKQKTKGEVIADPKALEVLNKIKADIILFFKKFRTWFNRGGLEIILGCLMLFTIINVSIHLGGSKLFKDYDDYKSAQIDRNYTFEFDDSYYVYIYSESCTACSSIKRNIFQYLESPKNDYDNGIKMRLLCADDFDNSGAGDSLLGVSDYKNIKVKTVPYLIFVDGENNKVLNEWNTTSLILAQLQNT